MFCGATFDTPVPLMPWPAAKEPAAGAAWNAVSPLVQIAPISVVTLLFAFIYKVLPDADIEWRNVWIGAGATALLFELGKFGLSAYLGRESTTSSFGAAGSVHLDHFHMGYYGPGGGERYEHTHSRCDIVGPAGRLMARCCSTVPEVKYMLSPTP